MTSSPVVRTCVSVDAEAEVEVDEVEACCAVLTRVRTALVDVRLAVGVCDKV